MGWKNILYTHGIRRESAWIPRCLIDREAAWNPCKGYGTCCGVAARQEPGTPDAGYDHIHLFLPAGETPEYIKDISPGAGE
jgi:hypothetical protein